MTRSVSLQLLFVCLLFGAAAGQTGQPNAGIRGTITDPSGAVVPGAHVQIRGHGVTHETITDSYGKYSFDALNDGKYRVRVNAKGFSALERRDVQIAGALLLDLQLDIQAQHQIVNVDDDSNKVSADPSENASALVLRGKELETLSDDPDELEQQLQAMAGPSTGPNGGQIFIDGFSGGNLPPKSSIREVRINSNPFSPEFDRPGFGRIEIFTKPGTDAIRGQAFLQFNNQALNSRSPLLAQSTRPPYQQRFLGFNLSGPIKKQRASFGFDFERRAIDENAFILATTLDDNLNFQSVNQAVLTPQTRTTFSPRIDYSINAANTIVARYQSSRTHTDGEGIGSFSLASRAYSQADSEDSLQLTETAALSPKAIMETRFQYLRSELSRGSDNTTPAIAVQGAFEGGGAQVGNSGSLANRWELSNISTYSHQRHTFKWGARFRQSWLDDTSVNNFGGTYAFFGGTGPELDENNLPIAGTLVQLSAIERYRRTLLFESMGYSAAQIRALGGGASQFSLGAGTPITSIPQFDIGLFWNDDWRIKSNLSLSYGVRYEAQTNIGDLGNWSPRVGIAWGIDGGGNKQAKTVLRTGFGVFYDRISDSQILESRRYNGTTQQSYMILNPDFFPAIPSLETLAASQEPQRIQLLYSDIQAPRTYQATIGIERQVNRYFRISAQYVNSRGVHLARSRNINTPFGGAYPFGDEQLRILTESTGFSRTSQFIVSPRLNYNKIFLFGFYSLSYGKTDSEGQPADPYNLRAEWGPSSFGDVRHRAVIGTSLPLPGKFTVSPFVIVSSGTPYNITTGIDSNGDGYTSERPALLAGLDRATCAGGSLVYSAGIGCFDLNPAPGVATIGRNSARGPANFNVSLRLARTWSFGGQGESGPAESGPPPGMGGVRGGGPPPGGGPGPGGPGGGPPAGMFGAMSGKRYNLTLSASARNILNHPNFAAPSGDLSSPFFGEYRSLAGFGPFAGNSTYNRKIDVQLRFTF